MLDWIVGLGLGWLAGRFIGDKINSGVESSTLSEIKKKGLYVRRAYDTDSQYRMLANNPYFMKYGPYGSYYGSGYDSYLSNWSPK
jgi:hypothetical protein